jgi:hypothetical protein
MEPLSSGKKVEKGGCADPGRDLRAALIPERDKDKTPILECVGLGSIRRLTRWTIST